MIPKNIYHIVASCLILFLSPSCKKEKDASKTTCSSTVYGYNTTGSIASSLSPSATVSFGSVDLTTASGPSTGTFANSVYSNQGAFNTDDNCYYVFKYINSGHTNTLTKISTGGAVTTYTAADTARREGLVYNSVTHKFYCLVCTSGAPAQVAEVTMSGSSFSTTVVGTATGIASSISPASSTVDNATGKMYFALMSIAASQYSIESYTPGSATTSVLSTGTNKQVLGLRFNKNDNMLYAIAENFSASSISYGFVKVAPSTGTFSTLATLPFEVNNEFFTAAYDACSDRYIVSTPTGTGWSTRVLKKINPSGSVVGSDVISCLYQGFDIAY